ncbi:MAG: DEAD/DEAH box helicase [Alphaproteobacteria bacterium]
MTSSSFAALGLAEPLLRALVRENYTMPTPIQEQAIPKLLEGGDILGIAQTGTGKTAAFALPILQLLDAAGARPRPRKPSVLVMAPTRELAIQIGEGFKTYGQFLNLRHAVIFGGVGQNPQVTALSRGLDVLIATPGRLLDLMGQGHVKLDETHILVLDEADRMLDMGFVRDVRKIIATMPKKRQSLLFSATMPNDVAKLSQEILIKPTRIEVTPAATTVELITQSVFHVPASQKRALLEDLLEDPALARVIVFTRTKHRANRVAEHIGKAGYTAEAIHGNKSQNARQRALAAFRDGKVRVLVATDIAARGIDIDDVTHVVNFELPNEPESYVHRIGRTARAGASGIAVSFCDQEERPYLRAIEQLTGGRLTVVNGHAYGAENTAEVETSKPKAAPQRRRRRPSRGNTKQAA